MSIKEKMIERKNKLEKRQIDMPKHPVLKTILVPILCALLAKLGIVVSIIGVPLLNLYYLTDVAMPLFHHFELKVINAITSNNKFEKIKNKISNLKEKNKRKAKKISIKKVFKSVIFALISLLLIKILPALGYISLAGTLLYCGKNVALPLVQNYKSKKKNKMKENIIDNHQEETSKKEKIKDKVNQTKEKISVKINNLKVATKDKFNKTFTVKRDFNGKKIVTGSYGYKKNKIIQDYVNINEIRSYYEREKVLRKCI